MPDLNPQEPPDSILLSHSHMDHMDNSTLARFPNTEIILPQKSENFLNAQIEKERASMVTGQTLTVGSLQITCVPALHGGCGDTLGKRDSLPVDTLLATAISPSTTR